MLRYFHIVWILSLCSLIVYGYNQQIVFPDASAVSTTGLPCLTYDFKVGLCQEQSNCALPISTNYLICNPWKIGSIGCCAAKGNSGKPSRGNNRHNGNNRRPGNNRPPGKRRNNKNKRDRQVASPTIQFACGVRTKVSTRVFRKRRSPQAHQIQVQVVGGVNSERNAWPWMALLGREVDNKKEWFCDGALINEDWILTAAHCIEGQENFIIRLGEHDYSRNDDGRGTDFEVLQKISFPEYNPAIAYHDLALIQISKKARLTNAIQPVCLPWDEQTNGNFIREKVTLTGWGTTEFGGSLSPILQEVNITVFETSVCENSYSTLGNFNQLWPNGMKKKDTLCVGDMEGGKDACQGDSGGPLVYQDNGKYKIIGVVSRGLGCGQAEFTGIYAPVSRGKYLKWIKQTAFQS